MTERAKLFGNDLQLTERGEGLDLVSTSRNDLSLAQGNDNIIQALTLRLLVHKGELARLGWPDYGSRLHELIGEPNITRTHVKLMAFARAAIEQDPRVLEVQNIQARLLEGERGVVRLMIDVLLISEPNPLNLVVDINLEAL
jgi:phage baseplate assembly protein W